MGMSTTPIASIPTSEPKEALKVGTNLVSQPGTQYCINRILQHRTEPTLSCVYLATTKDGNKYVAKNIYHTEFEYQLNLQTPLASLRNLRVVLDTVPEHLLFIYNFCTDDLLGLARKDSLSYTDRKRILRDTLEGLAALHERGILHGDIKPNNIFVDYDMSSSGIRVKRAQIGDLEMEKERIIAKRLLSHFGDGPGLVGLLEHLEDDSAERRDILIAVVDEFTPDDPRKPFSMWEDVDESFRDIVGRMTSWILQEGLQPRMLLNTLGSKRVIYVNLQFNGLSFIRPSANFDIHISKLHNSTVNLTGSNQAMPATPNPILHPDLGKKSTADMTQGFKSVQTGCFPLWPLAPGFGFLPLKAM
ncbi:hypothetical protein McanCB49686_007382 [Microsporum canis]